MPRSLVVRAGSLGAFAALACSSSGSLYEALSSQSEAISASPLPAAKRVFGQPDIKQTNYNEVVANRPFHPAGVFVDRAPSSATNSRVFVWDSGNNRVLAFDTIGTCLGGAKNGQGCTEDSFCGSGSTCQINPAKNASFALGQPSTSGKGACNGDNTTIAPATSSSLCLIPYPKQISPLEGPRGGQVARDSTRNIYLVDTFNNRVIKYNTPFTSDKVADWVFGQPSFTARACNQGLSAPTARTLCTGNLDGPFQLFFTSAVDVSPNGQQVWVADPGNHRVLKVQPGVLDAQLVLGQSDFVSAIDGCLDPNGPHMCAPTGIAYDSASNTLYVLDGRVMDWQPEHTTARVLVFRNPTSNGQAADEVWFPQEGTFAWSRGLTLEPTTGALWVNDTGNERALRFVNGAVTHVVGDNDLTPNGCTGDPSAVCQPHGTIGIDRDGKLFLSDLNSEWVPRFPSGAALGQAPVPAVGRMFEDPNGRNGHMYINKVSASGLANPGYAIFAGTQLVVADRRRILFWNNYSASSPFSGGNASGVLAQADLNSQEYNGINQFSDFTSVAYDATRKLLYATHGGWISIWSVPNGVVSLASPTQQILATDLIAAGGAPFQCPSGCTFVNLHVDAANDIGWVTDGDSNRVLRITSLSTSARRVDLVLGQNTLSDGICNRGNGVAPGHLPDLVAPNGFCRPVQSALDPQGNLFVVDGTWECSDGNCRVLEFAKGNLPAPSSALKFPNILPLRVFGPDRLDTRSCDPSTGRLCSPRFIAFDPRDGSMVSTGESYANPLDKRIAVWTNPVKPQVASPMPSAFYAFNINQAGSIAFDSSGHMAVLDHTWNRVVLFGSTQACNPATEDCRSENPACTTNAQCDDGVFCNGKEVCSAGACQVGTDGSALCYDPIPLARYENSLNFETFGERWYAVTDQPNGWQASNVGNRVIRVNGQVMSPGQMPLPPMIDGKWYFHFGPGTLPETQYTNWSFW